MVFSGVSKIATVSASSPRRRAPQVGAASTAAQPFVPKLPSTFGFSDRFDIFGKIRDFDDETDRAFLRFFFAIWKGRCTLADMRSQDLTASEAEMSLAEAVIEEVRTEVEVKAESEPKEEFECDRNFRAHLEVFRKLRDAPIEDQSEEGSDSGCEEEKVVAVDKQEAEEVSFDFDDHVG
jgi:hypothetical protein